ncbi:1-phosphofructokinase family hexose kinase [Roseobacter sp. YSTF-M11]|uniref:Phosphofructokinase n=1 Tax=Roseobacter insulae TaxID=2859783 RepID=A0A9X1FRC0_9RHOB|nr:1-phosphofructokinase family hexose kinase [Roseobacter insulae]MBW4706188.1 1-phosphofructokinase family hexose kinase [Roseobacter insulae]
MSAILTITLNPAVDLATSVERVIAGPKLYCRAPRIDPGGGGVNVARAICRLGGSATALVAVGGASGDRLLRLLSAEAVPVHPVPVQGETRESLAVTDEHTGEQFRFSLPGQILRSEDADHLLNSIAAKAPPDGYVVLSGGVAPGLGDTFPNRVLKAIAPKTDRLIVDTSKSALARLIAEPSAPVEILRLDHREAEQSAGHALPTVAHCIRFAEELMERGVARSIVTGRGGEGSILVTAGARYLCRTPQVPVVSKIGAGDAFVGALTLSLSRGEDPDVALQWGVAAASATMGTEGTELCDRTVVEALLPLCPVEQV